MLKEKIVTCINEMDHEDMIFLHNEYCCSVNCGDDTIYSMEDLDELCSGQDAYWIACRAVFGDFNANHDYIKFDGYGNFQSLSEYDIEDYISADDIADYIIDYEDSLGNDEIQDILDEKERLEWIAGIKGFYKFIMDRFDIGDKRFHESSWTISFDDKSIELPNCAEVFQGIEQAIADFMDAEGIRGREEG